MRPQRGPTSPMLAPGPSPRPARVTVFHQTLLQGQQGTYRHTRLRDVQACTTACIAHLVQYMMYCPSPPHGRFLFFV
jgi:hypothetical protein